MQRESSVQGEPTRLPSLQSSCPRSRSQGGEACHDRTEVDCQAEETRSGERQRERPEEEVRAGLSFLFGEPRWCGLDARQEEPEGEPLGWHA